MAALQLQQWQLPMTYFFNQMMDLSVYFKQVMNAPSSLALLFHDEREKGDHLN
jgi:hypothetical protein